MNNRKENMKKIILEIITAKFKNKHDVGKKDHHEFIVIESTNLPEFIPGEKFELSVEEYPENLWTKIGGMPIEPDKVEIVIREWK
tara:strand:+ start:29 stop:283 length:255 start_codon:yes stop_codon:yes gene_type:complete